MKLTSKLTSTLLAAMLAASGGVYADDYTQAAESLNGGPVNWTTSHVGTSHLAGWFTDTYTYTYSGLPGTATGFFANVKTLSGDIDFTSATLNSNPLGVLNLGPASFSYYSSVPVSGILTLVINGKTKGIASYAGTLDVISPVPEPAAYGMLLGGLALAGLLSLRRRQS